MGLHMASVEVLVYQGDSGLSGAVQELDVIDLELLNTNVKCFFSLIETEPQE